MYTQFEKYTLHTWEEATLTSNSLRLTFPTKKVAEKLEHRRVSPGTQRDIGGLRAVLCRKEGRTHHLHAQPARRRNS